MTAARSAASRAADLRRALANQFAADHALTDPEWRKAIEAVPREAFFGDAVFLRRDGEEGTHWEPLRRTEESEEKWLELAHTNATWVTQVDGVDAADATEPLTGVPTSSLSLPTVVVQMLEVSGLADGESVLEIGTGTGYSAALMCQRLGSAAVTSIEVDPVVAERARRTLTDLGYEPTLAVGDGLRGYDRDDFEYDRLIATCAVRYVPASWMWQVRDGGTITTPLWGWMNGYALAHLTLADDGTASGRFSTVDVSFMPARAHVSPPLTYYVASSRRGDTRDSKVDPSLLGDWTGRFVAQLAAPSAQLLGGGDEVTLFDVGTGSRASTAPNPAGGWTVRQHGPLRLWDAVEEALLTWQEAGSPHQSGFGLTVTRDRQYVWLDTPEGPSWELPA
ncbi:ATP-grasp peptide maturase system methyltransferase [Streptosporangium saharense]|uniref:ATP-grasp peptide maturase system methyltransferase n=1 Tax=Streptosporangium saharense TaxID=1706840 RepID=UPI003691490D